jgi:hypothetical protein
LPPQGTFPEDSHLRATLLLLGRGAWIGSSDGDCAPSPSHTTGHAVFRIRRLNPAAFISLQDLMA